MSVNMNDLAMTIYYSRHGESEANINLHALHVDRPKWLHYLRTHQIVDDKAKYFDTLLVEEGKIRVKESNAKFSDWFCENIDNTILLSSPNRRCVQTIKILTAGHFPANHTIYIHPHLREMSSTLMWNWENWPKLYIETSRHDKTVYGPSEEVKRLNLDKFKDRAPASLKNGSDQSKNIDPELGSIQLKNRFRELFDDLTKLKEESGKNTFLIAGHSNNFKLGVAMYLNMDEFQKRKLQNCEIVRFDVIKKESEYIVTNVQSVHE